MGKYALWYDNGTGYLEFFGTTIAESAEAAAKEAAPDAPYGYIAVTALIHDPERDGRDVILAEAVADNGMGLFNFD